MSIRSLTAATALVATLATAAPATACINVGLYTDNPSTDFSKSAKTLGKGLKTVSAYITANRPVDPKLVALAKQQKLTLLVSWLPDAGTDGSAQPKYKLSNVSAGAYDASLKALGQQLRGIRRVIFRPMPDANTDWYAWSGTVNGNKPTEYRAAFHHVIKVIRKAGGKKLHLKSLWSVYARSIPETPENAFTVYAPSRKDYDLVGADAYNFGAQNDLEWTPAPDLFGAAYTALEAISPKPFWIAETGSTALGGDKNAWISSLAILPQTMPKLDGLVWYDVKDDTGDFSLDKSASSAFKTLLKSSCK